MADDLVEHLDPAARGIGAHDRERPAHRQVGAAGQVDEAAGRRARPRSAAPAGAGRTGSPANARCSRTAASSRKIVPRWAAGGAHARRVRAPRRGARAPPCARRRRLRPAGGSSNCGPSATLGVDLDAAVHRPRVHDDRARARAREARRRQPEFPVVGDEVGRRRRVARSCWMRSIMTTSAPAMPLVERRRSGGRRQTRRPSGIIAARRDDADLRRRRASQAHGARSARRASGAMSPTIATDKAARSRPCTGGSSARRAGPGSGATGAPRRADTTRRPAPTCARDVLAGCRPRRRGSRTRSTCIACSV